MSLGYIPKPLEFSHIPLGVYVKGILSNTKELYEADMGVYLKCVYKNRLKLSAQLNSFYLLEGPALLNDCNLTKPHETENVDSAECPTNEDEDTGGEP